ncbi:hypothetical protein PAXINDRAFT_23072, partial [Paxillus involutus ATCC 200175]
PLRKVQPEMPLTVNARSALTCTIHFIDRGKALLVNYLDAKIVTVWTVHPWKPSWAAKLQTRMSWSTNTGTLLVYNLDDGMDVYCVSSGQIHWKKVLPIRIQRNNIKQVDFGWPRGVAISGTDNGEVILWNIDSG